MASTAKTTPKRSWRQTLFWAFALTVLGLIFLLIAARLFLMTAPAARLVENQINKRSFGQIERIEITGMSGDLFGSFKVQNAHIKDKQGVWLEAKNLDVDWKPLSVLRGPLRIEHLNIVEINVIRNPELNQKQETKPGKKPLSLAISNFNFADLVLDETIAGQTARFSVGGEFENIVDKMSARIEMARLDAEGDKLKASINRDRHGTFSGAFDLQGIAGGPLSTLLKAPAADPISGSGEFDGAIKAGKSQLSIKFGEQEVIAANLDWSDLRGKFSAKIIPDNWGLFEDIYERSGSPIQLSSEFSPTANSPFVATIISPKITLRADGTRPEKGWFPKSVNAEVDMSNVFELLGLTGELKSGSGQAKGQLSISPLIAFEGNVTINNVITPVATVTALRGPTTVTRTDLNDIIYNINFAAKGFATKQTFPIVIGDDTRIKSSGVFLNKTGVLRAESVSLKTASNEITGNANIMTREKTALFKGQAQISSTKLGALPSGRVKADLKIEQANDSNIKIELDGRFVANAHFREPLHELTESELLFKIAMEPIIGGINISSAEIIGGKIRTAVSGTYTDTIEIAGEAVVSAPYQYGQISLNQNADISYRLSGPRDNPALFTDIKSREIELSGNPLADLRLRAEFGKIIDGLKGPLQIESETQYGSLLATTNFEQQNGGFDFDDLNLQIGQVATTGSVFVDGDLIADGTLNLLLNDVGRRSAKLALVLKPEGGVQAVSLDADARNIAIGKFGFETIKARIEGTLPILQGKLEANGRYGLEKLGPSFNITSPVSVETAPNTGIKIVASPIGKYNEIAFGTSKSFQFQRFKDQSTIVASIDIADGKLNLDYDNSPSNEKFNFDVKNIPVSVLPLPMSLRDTRGRIHATGKFGSTDQQSSGSVKFSLVDWRGFEIESGKGLSGGIDIKIENRLISWALNGQSANGFIANGEGGFPVFDRGRLSTLRPDMDSSLSGRFDASGPASTVFGLFTPAEAEITGVLSTAIVFSGTATVPEMHGTASGQNINMEVPELGTRVRNGRFGADFSTDRLTLDELRVSDANGGLLDAKGEFTLGEFARPIGKLNLTATNFKVLDRRDADAWVDGKLEFLSEKSSRQLSGQIDIRKAEIRQFVTGAVSVVEIEVEEINRPDDLVGSVVARPVNATTLDIDIKAPRNIFIRSRGLDVEMGVDTKLKGTLADPEFYGEARINRGGYKIAGKTLAFQNGSIKFNGPLAGSEVRLKAETETQNLVAGVNISGTMENPKIDLSSSPERPSDEILSALLFGRSVSELSIFETAQLAGALAQFSGVGTGFDLLGGIRNAFGFNQLNINYQPNGGTQISSGRYLAKDVYLQLYSGVGLEQTGAIIDWEIRKNLALRSRIQTDYNRSLSLKWKKDF